MVSGSGEEAKGEERAPGFNVSRPTGEHQIETPEEESEAGLETADST